MEVVTTTRWAAAILAVLIVLCLSTLEARILELGSGCADFEDRLEEVQRIAEELKSLLEEFHRG